jgi:hypothetical protein
MWRPMKVGEMLPQRGLGITDLNWSELVIRKITSSFSMPGDVLAT